MHLLMYCCIDLFSCTQCLINLLTYLLRPTVYFIEPIIRQIQSLAEDLAAGRGRLFCMKRNLKLALSYLHPNTATRMVSKTHEGAPWH